MASISKSCRTASKPSEIEVPVSLLAVISSIPSLISDSLYDHPTRPVAFAANDTTAKRASFMPRGRKMLTSWWAKAFDPLRPFIEPTGFGSFIEPLSSSRRAKSIGVVQRGVEVHEGVGGDGG